MQSKAPNRSQSAEAVQACKALVQQAWSRNANFTRNHERAEQLLTEAVARDPKNTLLLTCLGAVLSDQGKHARAFTVLKRAVALGSDDRNTFFNLGVAAVNLHRGGMRCFKKAGSLKPNARSWEAYFDPHGH